MLGDNIKALRKQKGLTQEELAIKLNVVRQTVSKWEKGLSVPDADLLQKIADVLETDVTQLLGTKLENEQSNNELAEQLSRINEQLAIKNRRSRRIWKTIGIVFLAVVLLNIILIVLGVTTSKSITTTDTKAENFSIIDEIENEAENVSDETC